MARNETIAEYMSQSVFVRYLMQDKDSDLLFRLIHCDSTDFMDLTENEIRAFTDFAVEYSAGVPSDEECPELMALLSERMLYLAPSQSLNDRFAEELLVTASKLELLRSIETYTSADVGIRTLNFRREMTGLIGPIVPQMLALSDECRSVPKVKRCTGLVLSILLLLTACAALMLNLFVPAAAEYLTSEKLKFVYTLILGAGSMVPLGIFGPVGIGVGWFVMALVGSLMFNMFPLYAAMKIHSLVATAVLVIASVGIVRRAAKKYSHAAVVERRQQIRKLRDKVRQVSKYVNKIIHTINKETPMTGAGFPYRSAEEKGVMRAYYGEYCRGLREQLTFLKNSIPR